MQTVSLRACPQPATRRRRLPTVPVPHTGWMPCTARMPLQHRNILMHGSTRVFTAQEHRGQYLDAYGQPCTPWALAMTVGIKYAFTAQEYARAPAHRQAQAAHKGSLWLLLQGVWPVPRRIQNPALDPLIIRGDSVWILTLFACSSQERRYTSHKRHRVVG